MSKRKQYTREWKLEAVRLANEPDQSFVQVAKNLGVSASALHRTAKDGSAVGGLADGLRGAKSPTRRDSSFGSWVAIHESPVSIGVAERWCHAEHGEERGLFR
ncbi:hypothetical protein E7T06_20710 [Deinococcus sp. Arct2-2]|nr:hypothetical protein E7T06_20710 [Deinococcus sp. Arct2-2]